MCPLSLSRRFFAAIASAALCVGLQIHAVAGEMVVWYRQPAQRWTDASPLGNGLTAAMVFGGTKTERIALNNSSFWSGRPHGYDDPNAGKYFAQIKALMELDNFGASRHQGQPGGPNERLYVWGYDEITLFAHQTKEYRAKWLQYAWDWLQETDTNAHLQMPGSRTATSSDTRWYFANNKSDAAPNGSGDEAAIRAVWVNDAARLNNRTPPNAKISP